MDADVVEKSGAWYSYAGERIGQGRDNVRAFLKENTDIALAIESAIRTKMGLEPLIAPAPLAEAGEVAEA